MGVKRGRGEVISTNAYGKKAYHINVMIAIIGWEMTAKSWKSKTFKIILANVSIKDTTKIKM